MRAEERQRERRGGKQPPSFLGGGPDFEAAIATLKTLVKRLKRSKPLRGVNEIWDGRAPRISLPGIYCTAMFAVLHDFVRML